VLFLFLFQVFDLPTKTVKAQKNLYGGKGSIEKGVKYLSTYKTFSAKKRYKLSAAMQKIHLLKIRKIAIAVNFYYLLFSFET
jgi:hypothetical protein